MGIFEKFPFVAPAYHFEHFVGSCDVLCQPVDEQVVSVCDHTGRHMIENQHHLQERRIQDDVPVIGYKGITGSLLYPGAEMVRKLFHGILNDLLVESVHPFHLKLDYSLDCQNFPYRFFRRDPREYD